MQLISLSANKDSFKTVHFNNETGLNFIVASQKNPELTDKGKTTNGVGKSLIVALIHFCLGSSNKTGLKRDLKGWSFTLSFRIGETIYKSERSTDKQNKISLNGTDITKTNFNKKFGDLLFDIPEEVSQLSFRLLLPFFIRPKKASYTSYDNPNSKTSYQIQITNAFLLGLDVLLVEEKFKLRKEKVRIENLVKDLKDDELLKDFFNQKKDSKLESQQVKEDIVKLETNIKLFKVADDYYEINNDADTIKNEIDNIQNKLVLIGNQIRNIDNSRRLSPDIKKESIEKIYNEASVIFNEDALKTLNELEKFYLHLSVNREKRLLDKKNELLRTESELNENVKQKSIDLDDKLQYLNTHHALDIVLKLKDQLGDLKTKEENIERYDSLIAKYKKAKITTDKDIINSTERAQTYLDDAKEVIKETTDIFRELSKRFYPQATAGITAYNNDGDNQTRYDIDAKINSDASDGIGNIKIFCYDLTLLLKGFGHNVNFVFHDSRLLSDTDPRQLAELFRILNDYIQPAGKQYILTLNHSQLKGVKQYLSNSEYQSIIHENICLELKDESPEDKLLGIQLDLDYN
ncbi:DUF2326 domain-containing protein [Sulfurimonas sp.]|uniref:DUF2326 domain-containing protein n=1 Tax=Sulfurimonas sp. TaxID=2022749 RepID=UPI0025D58432|nr:DUF2326 domain-containing protein [Sulfurimonas sp.]